MKLISRKRLYRGLRPFSDVCIAVMLPQNRHDVTVRDAGAIPTKDDFEDVQFFGESIASRALNTVLDPMINQSSIVDIEMSSTL